MTEFEKLWNNWTTHQQQIDQLTFPSRKETEFQLEKRRVEEEY